MNRLELLKHLKKQGCLLQREGGRHSIWKNSANVLARKICKDLGVEPIG